MRKLIFILCFCFLSFSWVQAQVLELEKTYEVTGKSKRGQLAKVDFDAATGVYTLTYVTKSNDKVAKFQIYTFDKDFNFLNMVEDEQEFEKAKSKYKWFSYKGDLYTVEGLFVEPNMIGTLVLKRKKISYKYDWLFLGYYKEVEILEKVKPKNEEGNKYFYLTHVEDERTGDVYILCGVKGKAVEMTQFKDLHLLKYNKDIDLIKDLPIKFDFPQSLAFARYLDMKVEDDPDNPGVAGIVFMFAPMGGQGMGKMADPDMNNYTYVHVDKDLNLVDRISVKSYASFWKIDELIKNNDDIYLYGPSAAGKEKYFNTLTTTSKFKAVQLMKVSNHKVDFLTETKLEEFQAKLKTPPSQKKSPEYEGKKFQVGSYTIASSGDFFVMGQNFDPSSEGNKYKDVLAFQFDTKGALKTQYGVDTKESNKYAKAAGAPQFLVESNDKKSLFWVLQEITGFAESKGKVLSYPRIAKINIEQGTIGNFLDLGGEEYYLDPKYPCLQTSKGSTVVFFGANKKGKKIWFARVKLE